MRDNFTCLTFGETDKDNQNICKHLALRLSRSGIYVFWGRTFSVGNAPVFIELMLEFCFHYLENALLECDLMFYMYRY